MCGTDPVGEDEGGKEEGRSILYFKTTNHSRSKPFTDSLLAAPTDCLQLVPVAWTTFGLGQDFRSLLGHKNRVFKLGRG